MIGDVIKGFLLQLARSANPRIDYFAFYRAQVRLQSSDFKKLDVQPDDARLPGMTNVPIRHGLPGALVKVSAGAFVMVGFAGGNPTAPFVSLWEGGESVSEIDLGGTTSVARKGDHADAGTLLFSSPATIVGTYTDPDGVPTSIAVGVSIPLKAKISEGSDLLRTG